MYTFTSVVLAYGARLCSTNWGQCMAVHTSKCY